MFGIQRQTPDERLSRSVPPPQRFNSGLAIALASNKSAQLGQSSDGVAHRQSISGRVGDGIRPLPGPLCLPHCRQHPNFLRRKRRRSALIGGYAGWIGHPEDAPSHNGIEGDRASSACKALPLEPFPVTAPRFHGVMKAFNAPSKGVPEHYLLGIRECGDREGGDEEPFDRLLSFRRMDFLSPENVHGRRGHRQPISGMGCFQRDPRRWQWEGGLAKGLPILTGHFTGVGPSDRSRFHGRPERGFRMIDDPPIPRSPNQHLSRFWEACTNKS